MKFPLKIKQSEAQHFRETFLSLHNTEKNPTPDQTSGQTADDLSVKGYAVHIQTHTTHIKIHSHSLNDSQWLSSTTVIVYICNCVFFCLCVSMCPCVIWWVNISGSGAVCWWKECKNREITATLERKSWRRRGVRAGWPWAPILPSSRRFVHLSLSSSLSMSLSPWLARQFVQPTSTKWSLLSGRQRQWTGGYRFRQVTGKLDGLNPTSSGKALKENIWFFLFHLHFL